MSKLREAARDQSCVRCGKEDGTVVLAHYTGARRLELGGGFGCKVHDLAGAHLCADCHRVMDTTSRSKDNRWEHSEEFLLLCVKTAIRLHDRGVLR